MPGLNFICVLPFVLGALRFFLFLTFYQLFVRSIFLESFEQFATWPFNFSCTVEPLIATTSDWRPPPIGGHLPIGATVLQSQTLVNVFGKPPNYWHFQLKATRPWISMWQLLEIRLYKALLKAKINKLDLSSLFLNPSPFPL